MLNTPFLNRRRLSWQLLIGFGISLMTTGVISLWINYRLIQTDFRRQVQKQAQSITQALEFTTEGLLEQEQSAILQQVVQNYGTLPLVVEIAVVTPDGLLLADSTKDGGYRFYESLAPELLPQLQAAAQTGDEITHQMVLDDQPVLAQILPFNSPLFKQTANRGLAVAIIDLRSMQREIRMTLITSTTIFMLEILLILLLMGVVIRRVVLKPLKHLNHAVEYSRETGIFEIPQLLLDNEIRFLATTFERVFNQRQRAEKQLKQQTKNLEWALQELKQTQAQLVHSEKMSSLGQIVAGVAHEINNPVNFIHANLSHLQDYIRDLAELIQLYDQMFPETSSEIKIKTNEIDLDFVTEDITKILNSMRVGTERIRDIVKSLQTFARMDEAKLKSVNLHEGMNSTLMILENRFNQQSDQTQIKVIKEYDDLPPITCYPGQLNQVFMNILSNAVDALELVETKDKDQPKTIHIKTQKLDENWVEVMIADNGSGITEAVQSKIFDPFFTTKPVGKGTGLGLSMSYQIIVEHHQGQLECYSQLNQGTQFRIKIPIVPQLEHKKD